MAIEFRSIGEADERLGSDEPLTAEEARALFRWLNPLSNRLPRIQMDLALQQIEAINRFNEASAKLTRRGMWLVAIQVIVAIVAIVISLRR